MSMIIGRKQIILAALILALGTAIFLNYKFSSANGGFNIASVFSHSSALGDASYVDNQNVGASADNYFAQARLDRAQARAAATDLFKTVTANANATDAQKKSAETALEAMAKNTAIEKNIESLVVAKGFSDCVAFIGDGSVSIVVKPKSGNTLTESESAQIKDIVVSQAKVAVDKINFIIAK